MKPTNTKTSEEVGREWDALAALRNRQIESGEDLSYNNVLRPMVLRLLEAADLGTVLDVGCGTGQTTAAIAPSAGAMVAIDVSAASIDVARRTTAANRNVTLLNTSLEEFSHSTQKVFTAIVANMSLSTIPHLDDLVQTLSGLLAPHGHVVATIPHPCFWPAYWGYIGADWFNYWAEMSIEAEFRISLESTPFCTTHLHRPLTAYVRAFSNCGLIIESLEEPEPVGLPPGYSSSSSVFPRFIGWRCRARC